MTITHDNDQKHQNDKHDSIMSLRNDSEKKSSSYEKSYDSKKNDSSSFRDRESSRNERSEDSGRGGRGGEFSDSEGRGKDSGGGGFSRGRDRESDRSGGFSRGRDRESGRGGRDSGGGGGFSSRDRDSDRSGGFSRGRDRDSGRGGGFGGRDAGGRGGFGGRDAGGRGGFSSRDRDSGRGGGFSSRDRDSGRGGGFSSRDRDSGGSRSSRSSFSSKNIELPTDTSSINSSRASSEKIKTVSNKIDIPYLENIFNKNKLSHLEYTDDNIRIVIKKELGAISSHHGHAIQPNTPVSDETCTQEKTSTDECVKVTKKEFKSSIIGVYYLSKTPEEKPFIQVGSKVKKGDVLFCAESMKVIQEVKSTFDGTVLEICIKNGESIEYDQVLLIFE